MALGQKHITSLLSDVARNKSSESKYYTYYALLLSSFRFLFLFNITSLCSKVQRPLRNNVLRIVAASLFTIFISTCTMINFKLIVSKNENK